MPYPQSVEAEGAANTRSTQTGNPHTGDQKMKSQTAFDTYGADLEKMLSLRTYPLAIRMLRSESEIPAGAVRPKKDNGQHYAVCQVFSLARRQGMTVAMFLEDHWCFEPVISYGLVDPPQDYLDGFTNSFFMADKGAAARHARDMTRLPVGQYPGMVVGPLKSANFDPDLTMIYCNPAQLRHLLLALRYVNGTQVTSTLDPIGSCVHSIIPSLLYGECKVTVPDPGDFERAGAQEDEMVLTVPTTRLKELMDGVYHFEESGMGFRRFSVSVHPDFQQPPFYQEYFKRWGLDGPEE
jgi:uncharacterized protein (DUF169 family)